VKKVLLFLCPPIHKNSSIHISHMLFDTNASFKRFPSGIHQREREREKCDHVMTKLSYVVNGTVIYSSKTSTLLHSILLDKVILLCTFVYDIGLNVGGYK